MSDKLIQASFLNFAQYYYEQTLEADLKIPEMPTAIRKSIVSTYREDYGLSERHWLYLNSDVSRRAMVNAAVGWILECHGMVVHYRSTASDVKLYLNDTYYDLMYLGGTTMDPSTSRYYEVTDAESFFNTHLRQHPDEVDFIAAFTIFKRVSLYPFEPII